MIRRLGRCSSCGMRLATHFDARNAFIPCVQFTQGPRQAQPSHLDEPSGYPEITDQVLERIRRRLRATLDHRASV
jgi:hypothetical protein